MRPGRRFGLLAGARHAKLQQVPDRRADHRECSRREQQRGDERGAAPRRQSFVDWRDEGDLARSRGEIAHGRKRVLSVARQHPQRAGFLRQDRQRFARAEQRAQRRAGVVALRLAADDEAPRVGEQRLPRPQLGRRRQHRAQDVERRAPGRSRERLIEVACKCRRREIKLARSGRKRALALDIETIGGQRDQRDEDHCRHDKRKHREPQSEVARRARHCGKAARAARRWSRLSDCRARTRHRLSPNSNRCEIGRIRRNDPNHHDKNLCENLCPDLKESLTQKIFPTGRSGSIPITPGLSPGERHCERSEAIPRSRRSPVRFARGVRRIKS